MVAILGLVVEGVLALRGRLNSRPCPRCGHRVANGELRCEGCGHDFAAAP
jgi:transposase